MKRTRNLLTQSTIRVLGLALVLMTLLQFSAGAHPYASGIVISNGVSATNVYFFMNEAGAAVTVTFEDSTSTNLGVLPKGQANFALISTNLGLAHTSYQISCFKQGAGSPTLISDNAFTFSQWTNGSGFAVNHNAAIGKYFGRLYAANSAATPGTSNKVVGIYALNPDQTFVTVATTNASGTAWLGGAYSSNFKSPGRIRVAPDNTLLVADGKGSGNPNRVYQFTPDLDANWALLGPSSATGVGDLFGTPVAFGSTNTGDLVLYTASAGVPVPSDTNCIVGPLTGPGSFNCIFRYNIGSGPLPWNKRPDYAYTVGLDGIAQLRPEVEVLPNGEVIAAFGRANGSNPNLQILRGAPTTNGITGDPVNKTIADAARDPSNWLYTSGVNPPFNTPPPGGINSDPWNGSQAGGILGTYGGVRASPDQRYLASLDNDNGITVANLQNGIPNDATIIGITNTSSAGNQAGIDWDAADNVWAMCRAALPTSTGAQAALRCYSLGLTTTCVTSNDWTGTNGTFQLILPPASASLTIIAANASQNYVNCNAPTNGTPKPGVFRISLSTNNLSGPTTVSFVRLGTAAYPLNYTLNTNETPNGVTIFSNSVVFPAGVFAGSNGPNWNVDIKVIPTASPVSGGTSNVTVRLNSGTNYSAVAPVNGTINILNTGPQLLQLSAAAPSTLGGMNRGIPNDQARFLITRLGDLNGPGNDAVNPIVQRTLTINTMDFLPPASGAAFMAQRPLDYTAGPQNFGNAVLSDGFPGITFASGVFSITAAIGNPVKHTNTTLTRTNLAVIISLTNNVPIGGPLGTPASTTNVLSAENYVYQVATAAVSLNEFDNANGGEVVLWSNPLTSSSDSTNWTVVFASTGDGGSPTLPSITGNYDNSLNVNGSQPYVYFGKSVNDAGNDGGVTVPQSATMSANGWTTALKVTVNKNPGAAFESGVNLYPQIPGAPWTGSNFMVFNGNYALRFDMFVSLYEFGVNNPTIGSVAREYAAFGINHYGTNANWRLDINPRQDGTGAYPINADGEWCSIGAASGTITPADWDMFISPAFVLVDANGAPVTNRIPFTTNLFVAAPFTNAYQFSPGFYSGVTNVFANAGVPNDQVSQNNNSFGGAPENGIIKYPPFVAINNLGGAPDNAWIDVSLEMTRQTNLTLKVAQQEIFHSSIIQPTAGTQNPIAPFGGTPMLGYLDPNANVSDYSAFVYFSNLRVVELSPFIPWTNQPVTCLIVTQGGTFTLSSGALYASNPLTNIWYLAATNSISQGVAGSPVAGSPENSTLKAAIATNIFDATSGITNLTTSLQLGTNIVSVWSDQAGAITNYITVVEVFSGPGDKTFSVGVTANLAVTLTGLAPTTFQWKRGGTNLVAGTQAGRASSFGGVTTATLLITNVQPEDAGVYSNVMVSTYGGQSSTAAAVATVIVGGAAVTPASQTKLWGSSAQFSVTASGTPPFTYQWKKNGVDMTDGGNVAGATTSALNLGPLTTADAANYTAGVTNLSGGVISSPGTLTVTVPQPSFSTPFVSVGGGNVTLTFGTTNLFDTTNAYLVQTSSVVTGPYSNDTSAVFTSVGTNASTQRFNIVVPQTTGSMFYRMLHVAP